MTVCVCNHPESRHKVVHRHGRPQYGPCRVSGCECRVYKRAKKRKGKGRP